MYVEDGADLAVIVILETSRLIATRCMRSPRGPARGDKGY